MEFDQSISWQQVQERLERTTNPRHHKMLQTVVDHASAEARGDVHGLMATLSDDPQYHFWSGGRDWGPKGSAAVPRTTRTSSRPAPGSSSRTSLASSSTTTTS